MSDLLVNKLTGDIELVSGDLSLNDGKQSIEQHLAANLRSFRDEWFLNLDFGIPYFQEVFKKNPNPVIIDAIFKDAILNTLGVIELTSFDLTFDTELRKLILDFSVNTVEGEVNFEGFEVG